MTLIWVHPEQLAILAEALNSVDLSMRANVRGVHDKEVIRLAKLLEDVAKRRPHQAAVQTRQTMPLLLSPLHRRCGARIGSRADAAEDAEVGSITKFIIDKLGGRLKVSELAHSFGML